MTLTSQDLHGLMTMMPAFATADAADLRARNTVDVDHLRDGVESMIRDGADVIATTGSFGEFHTLLGDEYEMLIRATIETVNKRVPLFLGCTALNSREVVQKMELIQEAGGEGVLVGVPFYFPSTVDNAVRFYHDIAEMFPKLAIMVYHNPPLHNITLPVDAFQRLTQSPNVVAMKDSHRDTTAFQRLIEITRNKMSIFVNQAQYYPYGLMGAAGCWSIEAWMGPWPLIALRNAVDRGDFEAAHEITMDLSGGPATGSASWRETFRKIAAGYAGYCQPGPLRPPFVEIPPEIDEAAKKSAARWNELCAKYRPQVEAAVGV
jgi:dihydrodipicolinate synthase/N-acetylneuraminate lyase